MANTKKIILIFLIVLCAIASAQPSKPVKLDRATQIYKEILNPDGKTIVISHRGDWKNYPENSIASLLSCIDAMVDVVEVDVRKTKDGFLILMHDPTVDRTTNGSGKVSEMTLAQMKKLRLKDNKGIVTEYTVPTLEEIMVAAKGRCMVNLDKVDDIMPEALEVLKRTGTTNHAVFKSLNTPSKVNKMLESFDVPIVYMHIVKCNDGKTPTLQQLSDLIDEFVIKPVAIELIFKHESCPNISAEAIALIQNKGMRVWGNTLFVQHSAGHIDSSSKESSQQAWEWFLSRGIDMIQTNEPQMLIEYLQERKK